MNNNKLSTLINIFCIGIILSLLFFYNPLKKENFVENKKKITKKGIYYPNIINKNYYNKININYIWKYKWNYIYKLGFDDNTIIPYKSYYKNSLWGYYDENNQDKNNFNIDLGYTLKANNKIHALVLLNIPTEDILELSLKGNIYYKGEIRSIISFINNIYKYSSMDIKEKIYNELQNILNDIYYHPINDNEIEKALERDILNTSKIWDNLLIEYGKFQGYNSIQLTRQRNENLFYHEIIIL